MLSSFFITPDGSTKTKKAQQCKMKDTQIQKKKIKRKTIKSIRIR